MWARLSIIAGLVVGVVAAGLLLGWLLAFAPETPPPSVAAPSAAVASATAQPTAAPSPSAVAPSAPPDAPFHVGQPAPPLVDPQVGGGRIDLANLKGKPVWVNFMATWCPPCQVEFPLMNGFAAATPTTASS